MTVLHRHPMQPRLLRHLLLRQRRRPQPLHPSQRQLPQGAPSEWRHSQTVARAFLPYVTLSIGGSAGARILGRN
jgi:hypothetical protein